ncbi:MAG: hypothetical protein MPEBLZ_04469 [Candidatus Methanoperedens nitroreducens]|uniref:Uncharacterized protein n=1 Tax=Candidatus Methanoperedens nitratireducens TaxID=1392998 RepID=A0A0P8AAP5_9EURY|nr:hypothetical protein [Candidatus Methanoperedens sp. BLZ2]KAB2942388.1 MAG: hypothetical protein F9K14_17210 [Candidatus Methanoperedens sp.]KPQ40995.1 MAG: hypothetical protein MPEBLZ_04469 [Candidatus Methanoperedens sp. BLZ1]MBZ0176672.1 hypothetical protein [Candidatus Methanoperedens nitroreducens]
MVSKMYAIVVALAFTANASVSPTHPHNWIQLIVDFIVGFLIFHSIFRLVEYTFNATRTVSARLKSFIVRKKNRVDVNEL